MSNDIEAAHVLFPNDAPTPPPEWFKADQSAAEQRLMRRAEPAAQTVQDQAKGDAAAPAGPDVDAAAKLLFGSESGTDYTKLVENELDQYALSAISEGDSERADALLAATSSLSEDFRKAGTDPGDLREAFELVRHSAGATPPMPEQRQASWDAGMTAIRDEGISDADLHAARSFVADLERVSPGVVASLNAHGAGNSPKLIAAAVREARRRGY